jgi:hypothetical protein
MSTFDLNNKVTEQELAPGLLQKINRNSTASSINIVLKKDEWTNSSLPYDIIINNEDITPDTNGVVGLDPLATQEEIEAALRAGLYISYQGTGVLVISCKYEKPSIEIPINITFGDNMAIIEVPDEVEDVGSNKTVKTVLYASRWSDVVPYTQNVVVDGVTDTNNIVASLDNEIGVEALEAATKALLVSVKQDINVITIVARGFKPTVDIPISVTFGNSMTVVADYNITNISSNSSSYTVLRADSWSGDLPPYEQTVQIPETVDSDNGVLQLADTATIEEIDSAARAKIIKKDQTSTSITVLATGVKPTIDIPAMIIYGTNLAIIQSPTGGDSYTIPHDGASSGIPDADTIGEMFDKIIERFTTTDSNIDTKDANILDQAKAYADLKVTNLINSAGASLDTLKELADALGNDPNFAATITTELSKKATKDLATQSANGLMSFGDKAKLDGIQAGATNYTHPLTHPYSMITGVPTSLPANGGNADTVDGKHANEFAAASHGNHVPTPYTANNAIFLRNDNNWAYVTPANIGAAPVANPAFTGNATFGGNITAAGTITATKVYNAVWNDLAEAYRCYDSENIPEAGDIVEITDKGGITKASANSKKIVGVVSDCYAILLGANSLEIQMKVKIPVGLVGKVPVKIKGKCQIGDIIVSGDDGIGIVNNNPSYGTILGKVLEIKEVENVERVLCLISLS